MAAGAARGLDSPRRGHPSPVRAVAEVVCWWVALSAVWLLTASSVTVSETVAAAVFALPAAVVAAAARRSLGGLEGPRLRWWRWFVRVPLTAVAETVTALRVRGPGRTERLRLPDERLEARQAVATIAIGLSPGAMVADVPRDEPAVIIHRLVPGRLRVLDEVRR
jgi:multisubunit Na+/H+ antiporter MnhE subunit